MTIKECISGRRTVQEQTVLRRFNILKVADTSTQKGVSFKGMALSTSGTLSNHIHSLNLSKNEIRNGTQRVKQWSSRRWDHLAHKSEADTDIFTYKSND